MVFITVVARDPDVLVYMSVSCNMLCDVYLSLFGWMLSFFFFS